MKSIHYVSTVTNCYKAAVDAYLESPEKFEAIKQDLIDEMWKVAQRELATGFYYGTPSENEQLFGARRKIPEYKFVAEVVAYDAETQTATIRQRNVSTKATKLSSTVQVSVILRLILKTFTMLKEIKSIAPQIQWNF